MKRADRGLGPVGVSMAAIVTLVVILAMTMKVNSEWAGKSCGEQL